MKKSFVIALTAIICCMLVFSAIACDAKRPADKVVIENTHAQGSAEYAIIAGIQAFKDLDAAGIGRYFIDMGLESEEGVSAFGDIPQKGSVDERIASAMYARLDCSIESISYDDDNNATATLKFTGVDSGAAFEQYVLAQYDSGNSMNEDELIALWESIYFDPEIEMFTMTGDVKLKLVDGSWKVVADEDFTYLLMGRVPSEENE